MSKKTAVFSVLIALVLAASACRRGPAPEAAETGRPEAEWYRFISAHTSGPVSAKSLIRVLFVGSVGAADAAVPAGVFEFKPALSGKAEWKSGRELVFTPDRPLQAGASHRAVLRLDKIMKAPKGFERFAFAFSVIPPDFELRVDGLALQEDFSLEKMILKGVLTTSDGERPEAVEKTLSAGQDGRRLAVQWSHEPDGKRHAFAVPDVRRRTEPSWVKLGWNGRPLGIDRAGERDWEVPVLGRFEFLGADASEEDPGHLRLRFSDPLSREQVLAGLIRVEDRELSFEIEGNVIRAYAVPGFSGPVTVRIDPAVRNLAGRRLEGRTISAQVTFRSSVPQARFAGRGVIMPEKDRLTVPIETVNLKSVQVTALQVFSENMAQFFQMNNLEGGDEMTRVGRVLWRKTVDLALDPAAAGRWTRSSLDVTDLLRENPGSLFRITLSFNRGNTTYICPPGGEPPASEPALANQEDVRSDAASSWDYAEEEVEGGRWADRDDPCKDAFYNPRYNANAADSRNFIASNIGLIAKLDESLGLHVVTADLRTGRPISGSRVRVFNFQNRLLAEGSSDGSGFAVLKLTGRPFYVAAQAGRDVGYLRLSRDAALAMSHFDVGGEAVQKGIKGTIFGERGVWRPGDTLHLTFVLSDRDRKLPPEHPVTLELFDPRGQLVRTLKPDKSAGDFHAFAVDTAEDAPTGAWKARALVGGLSFDKTLRVETVVPNRLKVQLTPDREVLIKSKLPARARIESQWLHGAPASRLKFSVTARLSSRPTRFASYQDYVFDDPARDFSGDEQDVADGTLDENGRADFPLTLQAEQPSPGALEATFISRVFEETGDFSVDSVGVPFHPYDSYVGLKTPKGDEARGMLLTDQDHVVQIATLDPAGRPLSRPELEVYLYKIRWKWWWDKTGESLAEYASSSATTIIQKSKASTVNGVGQCRFRIKYPDWGRYLIRIVDPQSGHAAGKVIYVDWPGWAGRAREEKGAGANRLNFTADKDRYKPGDKAVIFLPEAPEGRALVSLENGSSVLRQMWVDTKPGQNKFEIAVTEDLAPNFYVHITLLQPHSGRTSDTPIRLYGVIPVFVENPRTRLAPSLTVADELKPRQEFSVRVAEKDGRPMTYTLAVVDEGLLGLTRYATPDLHGEFYKREALGVSTWDLYDDVVEAYGAELARILSLGGGEGGEEGGKERQKKRFPPVVLFEGPFTLEKGKSAAHTLNMPQYFGAVRVMVVAGGGGAYGLAEKSVPVRQDLMILPTLPRQVRPEERIDVPVSVFVSNPAIRKVRIAIETDAWFRLTGPAVQELAFDAPGDKIAVFGLAVKSRTGAGRVRFTAAAGAQKTEETVGLPVLSANPRTTRATRWEVPAGGSRTESLVPFGLEGTNEALLEVSAIPSLNLEGRLSFLVRYPHGCLEQTLSAAFPQLYLKSLVKLDEPTRRSLEKNIDVAVGKLSRFQAANGGFAMWPGGYEAHAWTSSYAGYFLVEAARLGFHVPEAMINRWKRHQKQLANAWTAGGSAEVLVQAFRLYTLALAGDSDFAAMNRLRESEPLGGAAAALLAGAFRLAGQDDAAADILKKRGRPPVDYRDDRETFGSALRDKAMMVRTLVGMGRTEEAGKLLGEVLPALAGDAWLSTQETAFALMAAADFYGGSKAKPLRFKLGWDGAPPADTVSETPIFQQAHAAVPIRGRTLTVSNPSPNPLFVTLYSIGVPPAGAEAASESGLKIEVEYQDMQKRALKPDALEQGKDFIAVIKVTNLAKRRLSNLALTHILPAGCQISNPRLFDEAPTRGFYDYQDVRDDRILTYFELDAGAQKTFKTVLNASYSGRYYLPGLAVESMYDASNHAAAKGQWISIVK